MKPETKKFEQMKNELARKGEMKQEIDHFGNVNARIEHIHRNGNAREILLLERGLRIKILIFIRVKVLLRFHLQGKVFQRIAQRENKVKMREV